MGAITRSMALRQMEVYEGVGAWPVPANDNWPIELAINPERGPETTNLPRGGRTILHGDFGALETTTFAPLAQLDDHLPGRRGRYIRTATGRRFYPHDPWPEDIFPEDIAHALGRIQRYGGHASKTYSVAEHCCLGSDYLLAKNGMLPALAFLLHDAVEALGFGDVPAPTKSGLPEYRLCEQRVIEAVERRFLKLYAAGEWLTCWLVKDVDSRITTDEMVDCMHGREKGMPDGLGITLKHWDFRLAQYEWMTRFERLYAALHGEAWSG